MKTTIRTAHIFVRSLLLVGFVLGVVSVTFAQTHPAESCDVRVTSPSEGDSVGPDGSVGGIARVPNGTYLWVLAHRKNINAWWPQGNGPADIDPKTGHFDVFVTYGQDRDHGAFEVAVAMVGPEVNEVLTKWFDTAQARGYPPMRFPNTFGGCPVVRITVIKG